MASTHESICQGIVCLFIAAAIPTASVFSQGESIPPSNLSVLRTEATMIADSVRQALPGLDRTGVRLEFFPRDQAWALELDFRRALALQVVSDGEAGHPVGLEVGILDAGVQYANPRRDGFFGTRVVDRTVRLTLRAKAVDGETGDVLFGRDISSAMSDVVELDALESLETPGLPMTRGTVPPAGFTSGLLEPVILIGAIAVAVFLLFTTRS